MSSISNIAQPGMRAGAPHNKAFLLQTTVCGSPILPDYELIRQNSMHWWGIDAVGLSEFRRTDSIHTALPSNAAPTDKNTLNKAPPFFKAFNDDANPPTHPRSLLSAVVQPSTSVNVKSEVVLSTSKFS